MEKENSAQSEIDEIVSDVRNIRHRNDPHVYVPNSIARRASQAYFIKSIGLILYGGYGLWRDDIYVSSGKTGAHFHGISAVFIYAAMLAAAATLVSLALDRLKVQLYVSNYRRFAKYSEILAWILFLLALVTPYFFPRTLSL